MDKISDAEAGRRLDELQRIHVMNRWHNCVDGYQWRITQRDDGQYVGELLGSGGGQLALFTHPSWSRVEKLVLDCLAQHRGWSRS